MGVSIIPANKLNPSAQMVISPDYSGPALNILVTGSLGFVGAETTKYLNKKGINCVGFDVMASGDIRDITQLEKCILETGVNRILHLAAIARFSDADKNPMLALQTNVFGTINVVNLARKFHIPIVYASTGSVYMPITSNPPITEDFPARGNSIYGCTKYFGECVVQEHSPYIILRYGHLYGSEKRMHGLIGGFIDRIQRGMSPVLYGGKQSNDFTYIKDIARANYLALTAPWDKWNQIYNIGSGEELTAEEAGKMICEITGYKGKIEKRPERSVDPKRFVFDCSKAENMLHFKREYDFMAGLKDMFSYG